MPFPHQFRLFTRESVDWLDENQPGVYGLCTADRWIRIGETDDLKRRLTEYLNGCNPCVSQWNPTHFTGIVIRGGQDIRVQREIELTNELKPVCNVHAG
jgi:hypothetical protein